MDKLGVQGFQVGMSGADQRIGILLYPAGDAVRVGHSSVCEAG